MNSIAPKLGTVATLVVICCVASHASAAERDDCNSALPDTVIGGCSAVLTASTDPKDRVIALIRRGEAYEGKGDIGAAVMDFIDALRIDPQHARARADLENISPRGGPQSGPDTPVWPRLVEGVAFPPGFDPTVEQNVRRSGLVRYSFSTPSGDWRFCQAACFADASCRSWTYIISAKPSEPRAAGRDTRLCRLMSDVAAPVPAAGEVSGVVRPTSPDPLPPSYHFVDGEAFGITMDTPLALGPIRASAFPNTGPYSVQPPKPHPFLSLYTANTLYRGPVCQVTGTGGGLLAGPRAEALLRELVSAFGKPAAGSTRRKFVWDVNSTVSQVTLEPGPSVTISFKNHGDCAAEEAALAELESRIGRRMPSEQDLKPILDRWPPHSPP